MLSYICFYLQHPVKVCFIQKSFPTVLQLNHSSRFCSKVIHNFLCLILVIRKMVKNLNTLIIPLSYIIHRQKFENNTSSIKNFQICLCKCIQKDPEVQRNKLNKSQWDGIFFFQRKETRHHRFFLSPVTIHSILYKNTI